MLEKRSHPTKGIILVDDGEDPLELTHIIEDKMATVNSGTAQVVHDIGRLKDKAAEVTSKLQTSITALDSHLDVTGALADEIQTVANELGTALAGFTNGPPIA